MTTYKKLVRAAHSRSSKDEGPGYPSSISMLRECLYRLANQYKAQHGGDKQLNSDMEEMLMATHYQHMYFASKANGLHDIAAKCAITMLKYPFIVPQDKGFYQAGVSCRDVKNFNLAFMLLNRYAPYHFDN